MVSSRNHAFEWARPCGRKFKWTPDQLVEWKKRLNYYSSECIEKTFEATTQLYPEITSKNQELPMNFYQERFHDLGAPFRMFRHNRETFSTNIVRVKYPRKCKHLIVFFWINVKVFGGL